MPASKQSKTDKICKNCKNNFLSNNKKQIYCSANCNTFFNRGKNPAKHRAYAAKIMRQRSPEKKRLDGIRKRELRLKKQYGISQLDFVTMETIQDKRCALCKQFTKLVVDHDHETGKVRGLLCHHCNRGLGFFSDNSELLALASKYVKAGKII